MQHSKLQSWTKVLMTVLQYSYFSVISRSLLKQCLLFEIFLQFTLPPPYTNLKLRRNSGYTRVQHCLWDEGRGWTFVNWKTPQKCKSVPRLLSMIRFYSWNDIGDCRYRMLKEYHLSVDMVYKLFCQQW